MTTYSRVTTLHRFEPMWDPESCARCGFPESNALHITDEEHSTMPELIIDPLDANEIPPVSRTTYLLQQYEQRDRALAVDPAERGTWDEKLTTTMAKLLDKHTPNSIGHFMYERPMMFWGHYDDYLAKHAQEWKQRVVYDFEPDPASHWNTAALVVSDPKRYRHVYGYARGVRGAHPTNNLWLRHSWVHDTDRDLILEVTGMPRMQYVGAAFPARMAEDFGIDIDAYDDDTRTRLLAKNRGGHLDD